MDQWCARCARLTENLKVLVRIKIDPLINVSMGNKVKQLTVEICDTSRAVCKFVNENNILKDDILALKGTQGNYILFYYK